MPSMTPEQRAAKKLADRLSDPFKAMNNEEVNFFLTCKGKMGNLIFMPNSKNRIGVINDTYVFPLSNPTSEQTTTVETWGRALGVRRGCHSNSLVASSEFFEATVAKMEAHDDDSRAALKQIQELLCPVRQMEIMADGCVHKRKSVAGKGGKGKVVAIDNGEQYTVEQGIARQVFWFLNSCSRDEDFRNACFDVFFLGLEMAAGGKAVVLPESGSDEAKTEWDRISALFFGVAERTVEPCLDDEDGLPIPTITKTTDDGKSISILYDTMVNDEGSHCLRNNIVQVSNEDGEEDIDEPIESPRFVVGCTISTQYQRGEPEATMPLACDDASCLDHKKFVELPVWAINRLRSLAESLIGFVPPVLEKATDKEKNFDFCEVAATYFTTEHAEWDHGSDADRLASMKRLSAAPWRSPVVAFHVESGKKVKRLGKYYSIEEKAVFDTYFTCPGFHDAPEHCLDEFKKYRRSIDGVIKPLIADAIGFKIKHPLIVVDGAAAPLNKRKRKPAAAAGSGRGGGSSACADDITSLVQSFGAELDRGFELTNKRLKAIIDHLGLQDRVAAQDAVEDTVEDTVEDAVEE